MNITHMSNGDGELFQRDMHENDASTAETLLSLAFLVGLASLLLYWVAQ